MAFYLNIESSKDINELHINFSDGSSTVVTDSKREAKRKPKEKEIQKDDFDFDDYLDNESVSQEIVPKPKIDLGDRNVRVADELQNLDI